MPQKHQLENKKQPQIYSDSSEAGVPYFYRNFSGRVKIVDEDCELDLTNFQSCQGIEAMGN